MAENDVPMTALAAPRVTLEVAVVRFPRSRCVRCDRRRVLYRIAVTSETTDQTEARCAPCWGIRS